MMQHGLAGLIAAHPCTPATIVLYRKPFARQTPSRVTGTTNGTSTTPSPSPVERVPPSLPAPRRPSTARPGKSSNGPLAKSPLRRRRRHASYLASQPAQKPTPAPLSQPPPAPHAHPRTARAGHVGRRRALTRRFPAGLDRRRRCRFVPRQTRRRLRRASLPGRPGPADRQGSRSGDRCGSRWWNLDATLGSARRGG